MPTPLPRISTLCVLPRPPGISSVFRARRCLRSRAVREVREVRRFDGSRRGAEQEIRLIEKPERRQAFGFGRRADAREVHVRRDVLLAGMREPRRRVGETIRAPPWCGARRSSAFPTRGSASTARAPRDRSRSGSTNPRRSRRAASRIQSTRAQIDLDAPARLERDAEAVEIAGERRRRQRPFTRHEASRSRDVDVHLAQAVRRA